MGTRARSPRTALLAVLVVVASLLTVPLAAVPAEAAVLRRSSVWLPYWSMSASLQRVTSNPDLFHTASPYWYDARSCGSIAGYTGAGSSSVITALRGKGVKVVPMVSASGLTPSLAISCFGNASNRKVHVDRLVALARSRAYDGLDLDYEHLALTTSVDLGRRVRAALSLLVRDVCAALDRVRKTCVITVMPRTSTSWTVWRGKLMPAVYDYAAIGVHADRVRVMAYDQHAGAFGPGPIGGYPWTQSVARFTRATVPPSKVELGTALYGRDFAGGSSTSVVSAKARSLAAAKGATVRFDATQREHTATWTSLGTRHVLWWSSAAAVGHRVDLSRAYGFAGNAFWAAGQEDSATWSTVRAHSRS